MHTSHQLSQYLFENWSEWTRSVLPRKCSQIAIANACINYSSSIRIRTAISTMQILQLIWMLFVTAIADIVATIFRCTTSEYLPMHKPSRVAAICGDQNSQWNTFQFSHYVGLINEKREDIVSWSATSKISRIGRLRTYFLFVAVHIN